MSSHGGRGSKEISSDKNEGRGYSKKCTYEGGGRGYTRERTYVYLWPIHVAVWQKSSQYCKAIILQLKIKYKLKKDKMYL